MIEPSNMVERLFFGRDDAEHDMTDGLLRDGFVPTKAFNDTLSGRKTLVIGRKGSGKSAICRQLALDDVYPGPTYLITPDDAAGDEIRRFELQGLTAGTAKSLIWRYVFAVQAARYLVAHAKPDHFYWPKSVKALNVFLRKNGEQAEEQFYDRVANGARGLQTALSLEAFGIKVSVDTKAMSEGAKASKQLEVLENAVARAFRELDCSGHAPLLLLVDHLEQVWSDDQDSETTVVGLLLAAKHVVDVFGKAVRCVVFLRSDIYDALDFGEGDKFHSDEIRIDWPRPRLVELALTRARISLGRPIIASDMWGLVFPSHIDGSPTESYLLTRTLPRPRDIIQYLNSCRDVASDKGHSSITESDVIEATLQFSQWKLQDLGKEYRIRFPFLNQLFARFQNTGYVVMRDTIDDRLRPAWGLLREQYPMYKGVLDAAGVVDILYSVGFFGVRRGADVVYSSGTHVPVQPHENELHIHPCFRPALNAVHPAELAVYHGSMPSIHVAEGIIQTNVVAGGTVRIYGTREHRLAESLIRACERILRQNARSGLPSATQQQVSEEITRVMTEAVRLRDDTDSLGPDPIHLLINAVNFLEGLAASLLKHTASSQGDGRDVVRRIQDETRSLIGEIGGQSPTS